MLIEMSFRNSPLQWLHSFNEAEFRGQVLDELLYQMHGDKKIGGLALVPNSD